ncbi:MAG: DMT family transporter [Verrucomicrobiota bacterium JB025]
MHAQDHRWIRVLPPVLICALLWGSAFPCIKSVYAIWHHQGTETGLSEMWLFAGIRFTIAGIMLLVLARHPLAEFKATDKRLLASFCLTQTFAQYIFFYYGLAIASGALAGLLVASGSFWWMILAPLIGGSPWPRRAQWLTLVIGGIGITLAAAAPGADAGNPWLGTLVIVTSTGFGTLGIVCFGKIRTTIGARAATGWSLFGGGLGLIAAGSHALPKTQELMQPTVIAITLWLAIVSAAAFSLWNHLSTLHPVPLLASYRFIIPLTGVLEAVIILNEKPGWGLWIGGAIVIGSLIASQRITRSPSVRAN